MTAWPFLIAIQCVAPTASFFEQFFPVCGRLPLFELLSVLFDASYTHVYTSGTRRHIRNALRAGASVDEIMAFLKLCVIQGVEACNLAIPILAEELASQHEADSES